MDQILETCTIGNEKLDLLYIDRYLGVEAYVNGEYYDVQSYEYECDARRDFAAFVAGHKTIDDIFR